MKKNIYKLSIGIILLFWNKIIFANPPLFNCNGLLPGCKNGDKVTGSFETSVVGKASIDLVSTFIEYIGVIAVISLMLGGVMYILSGGEDEKIKKAKSWIIWSMVGVFMSVSAWGIISFITKLQINN